MTWDLFGDVLSLTCSVFLLIYLLDQTGRDK